MIKRATRRHRTLSLLVAGIVALGLGVFQGRSAEAGSTQCDEFVDAGCSFFDCTSSSTGWTSSDFAVEYRVVAVPWFHLASGSSRYKHLAWKDTAQAQTSWPPMVITAYYGGGGSPHEETKTISEDGSVSGSSAIRVWTMNGTTANLCDGWAGRATKLYASGSTCIHEVRYGIDILDEYSTYGCLSAASVEPLETSALKGQNPATCPDGNNLTWTATGEQFIFCQTKLNVVLWNYTGTP